MISGSHASARVAILAAALALLPAVLPAGTSASGYREPPEPIGRILETSPRLPRVLPDPTGERVLLAERAGAPRFAGETRTTTRRASARPHASESVRPAARSHSGLVVKSVGEPGERRIALPEGLALGPPTWSPNGRRIAFTAFRRGGVELWVAGAERARARRLLGPVLHEAFGRPCRWMPDARHLLCRRAAEARDASSPSRALLGPIALGPETPGTQSGPTGTPALGPRRPSPSRPHLASRLVLVDAATGDARPVGPPGAIERAVPSPNGAHLLVRRIVEPHSLLVAGGSGPSSRVTEVRSTASGETLRRLGGGEGDGSGARGFRWQAGEPATLVWPERLAESAPPRDRLVRLPAPFDGEPSEILRLRGRFAGIAWIPGEGASLVHDYERRTRRRRTWLVGAGPSGAEEARLLWSRSVDDAHSEPGRPLRVPGRTGRRVVASHEGAVFLAGRGAGPEGARPFLDRLDLETLERERLWQSATSRHELVTDAVAPAEQVFLLRHESPSQPPDYALLDLGARGEAAPLRALTTTDAPPSPLRKVRRRPLHYQRADGVPLAGTLHVPAEREEGERLPLLVWTYPRKHASGETTAQATGSPRRYPGLEGVSPLPLATQGYAVLTAGMPVVGESATANDDFAAQIRENARAAVEAAVASGVVDRERVAIGGHSYGAFAAVSLLARTELFRAGVALSGAYNRTLTPFGFQSERRTLWEARETYLEMSPLLRAHRIRAPLLLVHGRRDAHPSTPPEQSVLLYRAIRENGGTARLVLLPREGHVYRSREATLHVYAELVAWLERHLKGASEEAPPAEPSQGDLRQAETSEGGDRPG